MIEPDTFKDNFFVYVVCFDISRESSWIIIFYNKLSYHLILSYQPYHFINGESFIVYLIRINFSQTNFFSKTEAPTHTVPRYKLGRHYKTDLFEK